MHIIDISGQKFNHLTVIERDKSRHKTFWKCLCDCGNETSVEGWNLRNSNVKSCGCLKTQKHVELQRRDNRLCRIYQSMKSRCANPNVKAYKNYGGRGITFCDEWNRFEAFEVWALTHGYTDTLTLDRIDNNGNYTPKNCRFVDMKTQQRNRRDNIFVDFHGESVIATDVAVLLGKNTGTISRWIKEGRLQKKIDEIYPPDERVAS
jgi:hypothetical protein